MAQIPNASVLSPAQIAVYAQNAGFSGADLITAVAVALAESSGVPNTYNPETAAGAPDGYGSYGLWQIYLNAHPEYANENLYDPQTNANAAYAIYSAAGGFSPWSTFSSGAYETYLAQAQAAIAPGASTIPSVTNISAASLLPTAVQPSGVSTDTAVWVGIAILAGVFVWGLFE